MDVLSELAAKEIGRLSIDDAISLVEKLLSESSSIEAQSFLSGDREKSDTHGIICAALVDLLDKLRASKDACDGKKGWSTPHS